MTQREMQGGLSPVGRTLQESWGEYEEFTPWVGNNHRNNVWRTDGNPHPEFPCTAGREEEENQESSYVWEDVEGEGKVFWRFRFISYCLTLIWLAKNSNNFPQVESVLLVMVIGEWPFPVVIFINELLVTFSLPCPAFSPLHWGARVVLVSIWPSARTASIVPV